MEHSKKRRKLSSSPHTQNTKDADLGDSSQATKSDKKEGESSPARCPICLGPPENRAKSQLCSHFFCFSCLKEWSKVKAECPLCKMPIRTIFYNIKSDGEFDEYRVKLPRPEADGSDFLHPGLIGTNSFENWWHYRIREYRSQLRRRRENELAVREASSNINAIHTRRLYYWSKTWVCHVDTGNRVRDVSAEFFLENPSQIHRLVPWLERELTVLYGVDNTRLISCVRDKIMAAVGGIGITSESFVRMLQPYLLEHTNQFVHEFVSFAKSPYDIYQYDRHAQYISSQESSAPHQRTSRRNRGSTSNRRLHLRSRRSRLDDSPDARENPNEPSSQSVMLSQTAWEDDVASNCPIVPVTRIDSIDPAAAGSSMPIGASTARELSSSDEESFVSIFAIPTHSYHYSGPRPSRRYEIPSGNGNTRDIEAPLVHQTIDAHRPGASSARQYGRMEIMRQHFDQHTRRRHAEARKRRAPRDPTALGMIMLSNTHKVIVISSDSEDEERSQTVLHGSGKPSTSTCQTAEEQQHVERSKIKKERSAECSSVNSSDSSATSDNSDIEFVKYVKPPHLRTPDVFIELSSTDDDAPGPSTRRDDVSKATLRRTAMQSSSSSSDSSSSLHKRSLYHQHRQSGSASLNRSRSSDVPKRNMEFFRNAPITPWQQPPSDDGEINVETMLESEITDAPVTVPHSYADAQRESSQYNDEILPDETTIHISGEMTSSMSAVTSTDGTASSTVTSQNSLLSGLSHQDKNPKKVFERGKVSVNFAKSKRNSYYDSDSDSDIDVGVEKIVPASSYLWVPVIQENFPLRVTQSTDIVSAGDVAAIAESIVRDDETHTVERNDCHTLKSRSSSSEYLSGESRRSRTKSSDGSRHQRKHKHSDRHHSERSASKESNNDNLNSSTKPTKHRSCEGAELPRCYL